MVIQVTRRKAKYALRKDHFNGSSIRAFSSWFDY